MTFNCKLKAEFATPENGWTKVRLSAGDSFYQFFPSYTPYDSFNELLNSLLKILDGNPEAIVRWNDEPTEHKFVFNSKDGQITFKVYEIINSIVAGKAVEERFAFIGSQNEVLRPFWKGLRDMQSKQDTDEFERQWRSPFPKKEMLELTQRIK
jgi:hypothetical protein